MSEIVRLPGLNGKKCTKPSSSGGNGQSGFGAAWTKAHKAAKRRAKI